jgi:hypothetical protein
MVVALGRISSHLQSTASESLALAAGYDTFPWFLHLEPTTPGLGGSDELQVIRSRLLDLLASTSSGGIPSRRAGSALSKPSPVFCFPAPVDSGKYLFPC